MSKLPPLDRRRFLKALGITATAAGFGQTVFSAETNVIPGFEAAVEDADVHEGWEPVSTRKIRMGIVGYGLSKFGAYFGFQDHPNVEVVAVSDLIPERCAALAQACRCSNTYPSLEEMVKDDRIEAIWVATDAPSHARHCIEVLKHGKHVASAVPAIFGSMEDADKLFEAVKRSGLKYMMFETSCYRPDNHVMRQLYAGGHLGELVYSEGEYYHYMEEPLDSYKGWRTGLPPQWYPTHSNAYHICVTGGSFTEVSCLGMPSRLTYLQDGNNAFKNPFGTEVALFRTSEGGMSRMVVSWDTPGREWEVGRVRGQKGSFNGRFEVGAGVEQDPAKLINLRRPPLPPHLSAGSHGGSHGFLTNEFVTALLQDRTPHVDIGMALNLTIPGIVAHQSALKDGELLKIPRYKL